MMTRNNNRIIEINNLLLTYYGDDLTGSTDAMEALELGGIPTVLFLEFPSQELLNRFRGVRAVGLAGTSRTMTPSEMDASLPTAFNNLKQLGAPITHYKVCSTFDSSPEFGSIGRAIEIGIQVFDIPNVPVMIGAPKLKRYVVFGNHFATVDDVTYRLDRHPTMSKHPTTPMDEGDLRLYLGKQTNLTIGLIDVHKLEESNESIRAHFSKLGADGTRITILDTLDDMHLQKAGELIWNLGMDQPTFVVGSSGVEFALSAHLQSNGLVQPLEKRQSPGRIDQIVAISGSAATVTANQIQYALSHGFTGIRLDCVGLIDPRTADAVREQAIQQAQTALQGGTSVILYSVLGPDDGQIVKTKTHANALGISPQEVVELIGRQQGLIAREILTETGIHRLVIAGGDTSGYVLRKLGAYVLEFIAPLSTATPLCRVWSHMPLFNGLEVVMKGGQLGEIDFFTHVLKGGNPKKI